MTPPGRRIALLICGLAVGSGSLWWWLDGAATRQGYSAAPPGACPAVASPQPFPSPGRDGLDRFVLPIGPVPAAPLRSVVCRYAASGVLIAGIVLDAARTAELASTVAEPIGGWPDDALAAKHPPPLTAAQLAEDRPAECTSAADRSGQTIRFDYPTGPGVVVRVRGASCASLSNGTITVRVPAGLSRALTALPALGEPAASG